MLGCLYQDPADGVLVPPECHVKLVGWHLSDTQPALASPGAPDSLTLCLGQPPPSPSPAPPALVWDSLEVRVGVALILWL